MPYGKYSYLVYRLDIIDMVASPLEQDATCALHRRLPIKATDLRCVTDDLKRGGQFREEEVRGSKPIPVPPIVDFADLSIRLGCGPDLQIHRR
jgi:hypothetical protein